MGASLERNTIINGRYVVDMLSPTQHNGYITYYCTDKQTDSRVMLKEFFPEYATRDSSGNLQYSQNQEKDMNDFNESHQLARKFGTLPTVVAVYDIFTKNNTLYAVCEFVQGRVVSKLWAKGSGFTFGSVQRVIENLLRTNEALGRFGMYQADFGPENVIITTDGCVKINRFLPVAEPQAERDAILSVANLGYFMLSGGTLSKVKPAPKVAGASNVKRLAAYLKYIYLNDNIVLTTAKILEDSAKNFDVKLSANFANKRTGQVRSTVDVPVRKGSSNKSSGGTMTTKKKLLAIGIPVLAILTLLIFGMFSSNSVKKSDSTIKSIKYSIDGRNYTELLLAEASEQAEVVTSDATTTSDASKKSGKKVSFGDILQGNYNIMKKQSVDMTLGKEEIGDSKVLYLEIELPSDSSCEIIVTHNKETISPDNASGKYKIDIGDSGKIVVKSKNSGGFGLFSKSSSYTISYTRKVLAKLNSVEYSVDSDANYLPVADFNPDTAISNIYTPDTTNKIIIRFNKDKGLDRTFTVGGKAQNDGVIDVTPGDSPRTIVVSVTVTDPAGIKESNNYTININVPDNGRIKAEQKAALNKAEDNKKKQEAEAAKKAQEAEAAKKAQEAEAAKKAQEAEDARKAQEAEDARKAQEAEAARRAQEAEDARKAQEAEDAKKALEENKRWAIQNGWTYVSGNLYSKTDEEGTWSYNASTGVKTKVSK